MATIWRLFPFETLCKYLRHWFHKTDFSEHNTWFIGWRTCRSVWSALRLSPAQRWERGRMDGEMKKEERRWNLLYSPVIGVVMSAAQGQSLKYDHTVYIQVPLIHGHVQVRLVWQQGTDTLDSRKRVVENCRKRDTLPFRVPYVLLPDRCFLFVPVRPADCSLLSIVVCRQWGRGDTFIRFSLNFLLMSLVSVCPWPLPPMVTTQLWWYLGCYRIICMAFSYGKDIQTLGT